MSRLCKHSEWPFFCQGCKIKSPGLSLRPIKAVGCSTKREGRRGSFWIENHWENWRLHIVEKIGTFTGCYKIKTQNYLPFIKTNVYKSQNLFDCFHFFLNFVNPFYDCPFSKPICFVVHVKLILIFLVFSSHFQTEFWTFHYCNPIHNRDRERRPLVVFQCTFHCGRHKKNRVLFKQGFQPTRKLDWTRGWVTYQIFALV